MMNAPVSQSKSKVGIFQQHALFKAETSWFHMFRDMIESGDVARMGPIATTVYLVIKSHTNFKTGDAFPSVELIAEKSGVSARQVMRELKTLEEHQYITKVRKGRQNVYTLREKVSIASGEDGRPMAVATWDYLPSSVQHAVADLKNVLVTGEFAGARIVHIERLQVNIQQNFGSGNVQINEADIDKLPQKVKDVLERIKNGKTEGKL